MLRDATVGAPTRVKHQVHLAALGTARAGMRASTSAQDRVAQDGDERWEGVKKLALTQKRMQEPSASSCGFGR